MDYKERAFRNESVALDDNTFEHCTFDDCELRYQGGYHPVLIGCTFHQCRFAFQDAAGRTIDFLKALYHGGFQPVVDAAITNIRAVPGGATEDAN